MRCPDCAGSGTVAAHGLGQVACLDCDGTGGVDASDDDDCGNCHGVGCVCCGMTGHDQEKRREARNAYEEDRCRDDD